MHGRSRCCTQPIASSTCASFGRWSKHWRLMLQGHWYMLLLAVDWTTATAYLLVSVVNCYRSYKRSRTLPRCYRSKKMQEKDSCLTWAPLAANPMAGHFLDSSSGIQVSTWCGSTVYAIVLWANVTVLVGLVTVNHPTVHHRHIITWTVNHGTYNHATVKHLDI